MKILKELIAEYSLTFDQVIEDHQDDFDKIKKHESTWLCNLEEKTFRLSDDSKTEIESVIDDLKDENYLFTESDSQRLGLFVSKINTIIRIANRINNFKDGKDLGEGRTLRLYQLFNSIKASDKFQDFEFDLNKNLSSFIVHLFSVVKHCQAPNR